MRVKKISLRIIGWYNIGEVITRSYCVSGVLNKRRDLRVEVGRY